MDGGLKGSYCDLNVPFSGPSTQEVVETAFKAGYEIVALNIPVNARMCLSGGGGGKGGSRKRKAEERSGGALSAAAASSSKGVPPPPDLKWVGTLKESFPKHRVLFRLSIIFCECNDLQQVINQPNAKKYDIIAVVPTNHDAMQACIISTTMVFDIISFDFEGPHWISKIRLNRQKGKVAADKEVYFELSYGPSLRGDEPCENTIYTANRLTEDICTRRLKNIVISSGASKASEVRSPKDVIGLGFLLGLDETTSRYCIREHAQRIVSKSDSRKYGKSWVAFIPGEKKSTSKADSGGVSKLSITESRTDESKGKKPRTR